VGVLKKENVVSKQKRKNEEKTSQSGSKKEVGDRVGRLSTISTIAGGQETTVLMHLDDHGGESGKKRGGTEIREDWRGSLEPRRGPKRRTRVWKVGEKVNFSGPGGRGETPKVLGTTSRGVQGLSVVCFGLVANWGEGGEKALPGKAESDSARWKWVITRESEGKPGQLERRIEKKNTRKAKK